MAITSPIFKSSSQARKGIDGSVETTKNIGKILFKKQKVKRESFAQTNLIKGKRRENDRRQRLEDELEAPKIVTQPTGPAQLVQQSNNRGWFDRILGFIGYLSAGWILNNLPTWIGIGKEFIARLQRAGQIMSDFYFSTVGIFRGMIQIFGSLGENLIRLDFLDTSNRVKSSISDLNLQIEKWTSTVEEALGLVTTPITEGKYSGQNIPGVGTEATNQGAYVEPGPGNYTGGNLSTAQMVSLARQVGMTQNVNVKGYRGPLDVLMAAVGMQESRGNTKSMRSDTEVYGLWQIRWPVHAPNLKKIGITSPEQLYDPVLNAKAAKMIYDSQGITAWEGFTDGNYKKFLPEAQKAANVSPGIIQQVPVGNVNPTVGDRLGAGRNHGGVDLQISSGTPLRAVSDGVIVDSDYERGWGNFLVMKDNLGIYHLYGHMQSGYKRGGPVKKGEVIGKVGMTGRTSGPHLHWETGTGWNGGKITGRFDALTKYSKFAPFNTQPGPGVVAETPAQVSSVSTRQSVPSAITPERRGQDIMIAQPPSQQNIVASGSGGGGGQQGASPISDFEMLNNFMKKKLLLDLAYL